MNALEKEVLRRRIEKIRVIVARLKTETVPGSIVDVCADQIESHLLTLVRS